VKSSSTRNGIEPRELGVKPSKQLNRILLDAAMSAEERLILEALPSDQSAPTLNS